MAAVTETLRLEDRFSAAFSRFINLGGRAAGSSRLAQSAAANYEAVASSLDQRIIGLNAQISVLTSEQKELAASGMNIGMAPMPSYGEVLTTGQAHLHAIAANTDSRLMMTAAGAAATFRCPIAWSV